MVKMLAKFEVEKNLYEIYGTIEISKGEDDELKSYEYPEFYELSAKKIVDGEGIDFKPSGVNWVGRNYDVSDMIGDFLAHLMRGTNFYTNLYLDENLQRLVNSYIEDIAININGLDIPRRLLLSDMYNIYGLTLVTNDYIYYYFGNDLLMLRTEDHSIVSDNYFASVGYYESCENIKNGKETFLYGELPEDYN